MEKNQLKIVGDNRICLLFWGRIIIYHVRKANLQVVAGPTVDGGGVCTAAISCLDTRASVV